MRPIEFRAWHKESGKMIYPGDYGEWERQDEEPQYGYWDEWFSSEWGIITGAIEALQKDYIPMQFTGLHDKNGKKIFEGDVIDIETYYGRTCRYYIKNLQVFFEEKGFSEQETLEDWSSSNLLVIGNFYEHPELLLRITKGG